MTSILFICLGNICRSPMAEYICRALAQQRGLAVRVASAGTSGWHDGENMHCGTAEVLEAMGINSTGFVSRKVRASDFRDFDYLVVMDDNNLADVQSMFGKHHSKIFKLTDLMPESPYTKVPDPWYTGNFNEVRDLLVSGCGKLLDKISAEV